jgi:hypothetical protein
MSLHRQVEWVQYYALQAVLRIVSSCFANTVHGHLVDVLTRPSIFRSGDITDSFISAILLQRFGTACKII